MTYLDATLALVIGLGIVVITIWWLTQTSAPTRGKADGSEQNGVSFLFRNGALVDVTPGGETILGSAADSATLETVLDLFRDRFPLPQKPADVEKITSVQSFTAIDAFDPGVLEISKSADTIRFELLAPVDASTAISHELHQLHRELDTLRKANETTPCPVWQVDTDGKIAWFNPAYASLFSQVHGEAHETGQMLFETPHPKLEVGKTRRVPISLPNKPQSAWYDIQRSAYRTGDFYSAVDANAIVRAEAAQRNFVQTLAKTFAHLPIGLAIFDENRQLVLFNPAVIDLTGLGADFLSSRPNLLSFFDELRNRRLMPEPKNYNSWRQQIADLVAAAADGRYSETWTLDSGRTYRVNGRPHPDGAIAFLIEDISSEVSLTRSFRAELELGQSVLDQLDEAIVVFDANGVLTISNASYRKMWAMDPSISFANTTIMDCQRLWQEACVASPSFADLRDFVLNFSERATWADTITKTDGSNLTVTAEPLVSGATLIRFAADPSNAARPLVPKEDPTISNP